MLEATQRLKHRTTWLLRPLPAAQISGYLQIGLAEAGAQPRVWLLPVGGGLSFFVSAGPVAATLTFNPEQAVLEPVSLTRAAFAQLRCRFKVLSHGVLNFGGIKIFPAGAKQQYKTYCKHVRYARNSRTPPDGQIMHDHPELITGWSQADGKTTKTGNSPRIAVALHLYYTELWPEIAELLGRWQLPFTLFLTLTQENTELARRVVEIFPSSMIRIVENSGRDVRPFLLLLEDGVFDEFDFICKIHGKKSISHGRIPIFGDIWRRATFLDLIATDRQVQKIVKFFQDDPQIGIIGPSRFHPVSTSEARRDLLGNNRVAVELITARMGYPLQENDFDFFEGTMFWVRPQALAPLRALRLTAEFDAAQSGYGDGALEHAVERLFNHAVRVAGFRAMEVSGENQDELDRR